MSTGHAAALAQEQPLCHSSLLQEPRKAKQPIPAHAPDTVAVVTLTPRTRACASNEKGSPATPSCTPCPPPPLTSLSAPRVLRSCVQPTGAWEAVGSGKERAGGCNTHSRNVFTPSNGCSQPQPTAAHSPLQPCVWAAGGAAGTCSRKTTHSSPHLVQLPLQPLANEVHGVRLAAHVLRCSGIDGRFDTGRPEWPGAAGNLH